MWDGVTHQAERLGFFERNGRFDELFLPRLREVSGRLALAKRALDLEAELAVEDSRPEDLERSALALLLESAGRDLERLARDFAMFVTGPGYVPAVDDGAAFARACELVPSGFVRARVALGAALHALLSLPDPGRVVEAAARSGDTTRFAEAVQREVAAQVRRKGRSK